MNTRSESHVNQSLPRSVKEARRQFSRGGEVKGSLSGCAPEPPPAMPGPVPGIHDFSCRRGVQVVDGRDKPGHDGKGRRFSRGLRPIRDQ